MTSRATACLHPSIPARRPWSVSDRPCFQATALCRSGIGRTAKAGLWVVISSCKTSFQEASYEGVEVNAAQVPIAVMQLGSLDPPRFPVKSNREQRVAVVEQAVLASLETWNIKRQVAR